MQAFHFIERQTGAGRIIRVGEEDNPGLARHRLEDGVDVGGVIGFRHGNRPRAGAERDDRIDQKAMRGVDRLVAVAEIGVGEQVQEIVGTGAADDTVGIESERASDRLA